MTWLTDEDRENQKRLTPKDDNIPEYTYLFRDNDDGSTFRKRMKNGKAENDEFMYFFIRYKLFYK